MPPSLFRIERNARLCMGGIAVLTIAVLMLFKTDLVRTQPSFDAYGWYTVSKLNPEMSIAQRMEDEAVCRARSQRTGVTCTQGKSLNKSFFAPSGAP
jgi:hypothetical protein